MLAGRGSPDGSRPSKTVADQTRGMVSMQAQVRLALQPLRRKHPSYLLLGSFHFAWLDTVPGPRDVIEILNL